MNETFKNVKPITRSGMVRITEWVSSDMPIIRDVDLGLGLGLGAVASASWPREQQY
jgi:hypothetical protein